ncbi:MAG: hypothetical protein ACJ746_31760 [Bryobacteraceae bacterium]
MERGADAANGLALSDAVLEELKEQSPEGCLLCLFDDWDLEEWD